MPMLTTATSHRTPATLREVAVSHSRSRSLSAASRDVFARLVGGYVKGEDAALDEILEDAFFEAAVSLSTRFGQSYVRRCHGSDLHALRDHILAGGTVAAVRTTVTLVIESGHASDAVAMADTLRRFRTDDATIVSVDYTNTEA